MRHIFNFLFGSNTSLKEINRINPIEQTLVPVTSNYRRVNVPYEVYKKTYLDNNYYLTTLLLPKGAIVYQEKREGRCSMAEVIKHELIEATNLTETVNTTYSIYEPSFKYTTGEIVKPVNEFRFDPNDSDFHYMNGRPYLNVVTGLHGSGIYYYTDKQTALHHK